MQTVDDEEQQADEDFWTQDFFAEKANEDTDYSTESEDADVADSDFDKTESEDDEDGEANEAKAKRTLTVKKPKEKPPGWKQAAQRRANLMRALRAKEKEAGGATADDSDEAGPSTASASTSCLVL